MLDIRVLYFGIDKPIKYFITTYVRLSIYIKINCFKINDVQFLNKLISFVTIKVLSGIQKFSLSNATRQF